MHVSWKEDVRADVVPPQHFGYAISVKRDTLKIVCVSFQFLFFFIVALRVRVLNICLSHFDMISFINYFYFGSVNTYPRQNKLINLISVLILVDN